MTKMKYFKRAGIYKNSTGTNTFNPVNSRAVSYNWWVYCTFFKGKIIFNNYKYSPTTGKHQRIVLLEHLKKTPDLFLEFTPKSLDTQEDIIEALKQEIKLIKREIYNLLIAIKRPRSRRDTNMRRREKITKYLKKISKIREILNT